VELHLSKVGDAYLYHHDYPGSWVQLGNPDLMQAETFFVPHILHGDYPPPVLSDAGTLNVLGYVKTHRFFVWLGAGNDAGARLDYTLAGRDNSFRFQRLSRDASVKGKLVFPNPHAYAYKVTVNEDTITEKTTDREIRVPFGLNDSVRISRAEP
jgi:hypothetical protein